MIDLSKTQASKLVVAQLGMAAENEQEQVAVVADKMDAKN